MKKFNKFGYAGAIALATAMSFSACSSDDEMENINPTYDGSSVKTQFSISLTQKAGKGGRMATAYTGEVGGFQGISDMYLYQFDAAIEGTSKSLLKNNLGSIASDWSGGQVFQNANINAKYYTNQEFLLGVKHLLFYGTTTATGAGAGQTACTWADKGQDVEVTTFSPVTVLPETPTAFNNAFDAMITKLNAVYALFNSKDLPFSVSSESTKLEALTSASSDNVKAIIEDIYVSIEDAVVSMADGAGKTATQKLLGDILTTGSFEKSEVAGVTKLSWKTGTDPQFPVALGLPAGSVAITFTRGVDPNPGTFSRVDDNSNTGLANATKPSLIVHPAKLMFFANSPVGTYTDAYFAKESVGTKTWKDVQDVFTGTEITMNTRSVILKNPINYGMAKLATTVKFAAATIQDAATQDVAVNDKVKFNGILVGNQKAVDWKFEQNTGATAYTIYDNQVGAANITTTASTVQNTLVYESRPASTKVDAESYVYIAVELVNNTGADFKGVDGIIPDGGTFYLVGRLQPELATGNVDGENLKLDRVFKQDHVTTANININSLAQAYNVIPDLTTPTMEFGMSVDLSWSTGLTFDVTIP